MIPAGSTYTVSWLAPPIAKKLKLEYSTDNGATWKKIANNLSGTSHKWTVPAPQSNKNTCLVSVTGYDASGVKVVGRDKSDAPFTIEVASITAPTYQESVRGGTVGYPVRWITNGISEVVSSAELFYTLAKRNPLSDMWEWSGIWKKAAGEVVDPLTGFKWDVPSPAIGKPAKLKVVFKDDSGNKVATAISSVFYIR